jgi:hypothetical protein
MTVALGTMGESPKIALVTCLAGESLGLEKEHGCVKPSPGQLRLGLRKKWEPGKMVAGVTQMLSKRLCWTSGYIDHLPRLMLEVAAKK